MCLLCGSAERCTGLSSLMRIRFWKQSTRRTQPTRSRLRTALQNALIRSDDFLCAALDSPPQTNEIARSAMLLPGFLSIARQSGLPLRIHEIGSSAGLNLFFDRFHYRYGEAEAGDPTSPVRLAPEVRGSLMPLDAAPTILSRSGSDIAPLDVSDEALRLRLRSIYLGLTRPLGYNGWMRLSAWRGSSLSRSLASAPAISSSRHWRCDSAIRCLCCFTPSCGNICRRRSVAASRRCLPGGRAGRSSDCPAAHGAARCPPAARDAHLDAHGRAAKPATSPTATIMADGSSG